MHSIRAYLTLCLLAILAACSSLPSKAPIATPASLSLHQQHLASLSRIQQFELKGRLGVQADGKGYSASLIWQHNADHDDIRIYSPLGGQLARIQKTADGIRLEDAQGQVSVGKDAESLTQALLGWRLPLSGLADWVLGRPTNSAMASLTWDEAGHTLSLNEADWAIVYQQYQASQTAFLPHKLSLKNARVQLKLIVEKWTLK
ncbi:MAG: lipoprotein insertase outer membrane protein LolB [Candidatus Methylopumilus sp.]|nr:lipoprotein insertase outer membrane protein LolB [Candidatus Methylopumilus sp.]